MWTLVRMDRTASIPQTPTTLTMIRPCALIRLWEGTELVLSIPTDIDDGADSMDRATRVNGAGRTATAAANDRYDAEPVHSNGAVDEELLPQHIMIGGHDEA